MFLSDLSIRRPVFAAVIMLTLVTLGVFSYRRLGLDFFPNVEIPVVLITTSYPGASPETVEREVSKRIEEAESRMQDVLYRFGFIAHAHIDMAQRLLDSRERFDRVIQDKKIESRERYLKLLPRLTQQLQRLADTASDHYVKKIAPAKKPDAKILSIHVKQIEEVVKIYPKFFFKSKIVEDFVAHADDVV